MRQFSGIFVAESPRFGSILGCFGRVLPPFSTVGIVRSGWGREVMLKWSAKVFNLLPIFLTFSHPAPTAGYLPIYRHFHYGLQRGICTVCVYIHTHSHADQQFSYCATAGYSYIQCGNVNNSTMIFYTTVKFVIAVFIATAVIGYTVYRQLDR